MKCLIIDNYDSFTYNLVYLVKELNAEHRVVRNDKFELGEVEDFDKIILSPGPGIPEEAGKLKEVIKTYAHKKSILGVCLGEQAIAEVFGGKLINLEKVYHGVKTKIEICKDDYIFNNIPQVFEAGRYHSWVVSPELPDEIECIARDEQQQIMAIRHKKQDVRGVQFHPESIMTTDGKRIIENFLTKK